LEGRSVIRRIDHVVAVVQDYECARRVWVESGCPVIWDGWIREQGSCCFSVGAINLELNSADVLESWPALLSWREWTARQFGLHAVALDPGDLDATIDELRGIGFEPTEPREGSLTRRADGASATAPSWRNSLAGSLLGLLPGLPSFLCQFTAPGPSLGCVAPDSPVRFVELRVGVADPVAAARSYERVLAVTPQSIADGVVIPPADTPIRLIRGDQWQVVLEPLRSGLKVDALASHVPGLVWA
jgi:hypothetical protein